MLLEAIFGRKQQASDITYGPARSFDEDGFPTLLQSGKTNAGESVTTYTAFTYSAVWCATMRRCGTLAAMPKNLYRRGMNPKTGLREKLIQYDSPIQRILHTQANPEMCAFSYHAYMEEKRLNAGNAYAEIEWELVDGEKVPLNLWPIHPSRVTILRGESDNRIIYEVANKVRKIGDPPMSYIEAADMIHLPSLMMRDTLEGMGTIEFARETIGFGLATERHGAKTFGSGTMPKAVLTNATEKMSNPDTRKNFRSDWREVHQKDGFDIAILNPGQDIKPLTLGLRDNMYLETRQHNLEEICRWYDLPPHTLHHLLRATNNNIEEMSIGLVVYSLVPWIVPNEQHYLYKLMPSEEERSQHYLKWEVNGLMRGNSAARAAFYHNGITDGWLSPNDATELEDFNPFPGGDQHFIQGAMAPITEDGSLGETMSQQNAPEPDPEEPATVSPPQTATVTEPIVVVHPEDTSDTASTTSGLIGTAKLKVVAREFLQDTLERMVRQETKAARHAAKNPKDWLSWLDEFYTTHSEKLGTALVRPMEACSIFGVANEPEAFGRKLAEGSKRRLLELSGSVTPNEFAPAVDALMNDWERDRAANCVRGIEELN
tara:strand:- start:22 stop:1827 length:1806 start_codon:yes stop_codon:yes gene_type:complete